MSDAPVSYKDPFWSNLAGSVEAKLDLPKGILVNVVTRGERSNADQVSEDNARTPFQIIPATRAGAIKKWGIDPYLSADNAAEVAGLLLKDSLSRNKGDQALAVGEYHGGTDRAAWGPRTKSYVNRVMTGLRADGAAAPAQAASAGQSTYDKVSASMKVAAPQEPQIAAIFSAYQSGQMTPEDAAQFEQAVKEGGIMLPRGATLKGGGTTEPAAGIALPSHVVDAYNSGRMAANDMAELDAAVKSGAITLPEGAGLTAPAKPGVMDRIAAIPGQVMESITGTKRTTSETEALPDWAGMPELNSFSLASAKTGLGTLLSNPQETVQVIKSNFPAVQTRQDEKGNHFLRSSIDGKEYAIKPGFKVSDIPRAAGAIAAFTPAGRATTVLGSGLAAAGTQALIEGTQAATGGEFNPGDVALAGGMGVALPAVVNAVRATAQPARNLLNRVRGQAAPEAALAPEVPVVTPTNLAAVAPEVPTVAVAGESAAPAVAAHSPAPAAAAAEATPSTASAGAVWRSKDLDYPVEVLNDVKMAPDGRAYQQIRHNGQESYVPQDEIVTSASAAGRPSTAPAAPAQPAAPAVVVPTGVMSATDLAQTAKKAADGGLGSSRATKVLAEQAAPDPKVLEAAKRLGIDDYLQPDHVTTNQAYRELAQAVKSFPGSEARAAELGGLEKVAKRADDLIEEVGGTTDMSVLDSAVKGRLTATQHELEAKANSLYNKIREEVPQGSPAPAPTVIEFVAQRAKDLGGVKNLTPMEKQIMAKLAPKRDGTQPTYALLDDVRKDLGAAARMGGPFKDADTGLSKKLYSLLSDDQATFLQGMGMADIHNAARTAVSVRKGLEDDLSALFGKNIDQSLVAGLSGAVKSLPTGDTSKLIRLLKAIPDDMRQEVVASGLNTAFGKNARNGSLNFSSYSNWYEGLLRNKQAYAALMANLPQGARKQLSDLYRVSSGISAATRELITTGRINAVSAELKGTDSLMSSIYVFAKRATVAAPLEAATTAVGLPGTGLAAAIGSAFAKGKPNTMKAADALIASPEFTAMAKQAGKPGEKAAATQLSRSKAFTRFMRAVGLQRELKNGSCKRCKRITNKNNDASGRRGKHNPDVGRAAARGGKQDG